MAAKSDFRTGRHVVYKLQVHLVFITKYRHGVITKRVHDELESSMKKVCESFECELLEFNSEHDHVHLLVAYPPKVDVSSLVNSLKGVSARRIRKLQLPEIKGKLWGTAFWSPSYCAVSAGGASLAILKKYIQEQRSPA